MYILADYCSKSAIAVDPVEPEKVFRVLDSKNISLKAVLTTHHHLDHDGGNETIATCSKNTPIYGGDKRIKAMTHILSHSEEFHIGELNIKCLHTPCHTSGHVCYFTEAGNLGHICFTGDTLFVGGCGRFFEGTAAHMLKSLNILGSLPLNTKIYCGHEYTMSNLKFALSVEPDNKDALTKLKVIEEKLKKGEHSVPSCIEDELKYNPFMRTSEKSVQQYTNQADPISVMKVLREKKDAFK
nr:hydroxyacylglutathione hydrolase, mitochondrial-like [Parasteatoda tepidariorum]